MAPSGLALEETELRLGLPGGGGGGEGSEAAKSSGKRGFAETIDLKLQLQTPPADAEQEEAAQKGEEAPPKHKYCGSPGDGHPDEKPPAPKAQVVGWPPVRSFRKNILSSVHRTEKGSSSSKEEVGGDESSNPVAAAAAAALVKVSMDGAPYLRKVDLKMYGSYQDLSIALQKMFSSFTNTGGYYGTQQLQQQGMEELEMSKVMDVLHRSEYVPTYEDRDGDWMLVGDVPWEMFVNSCKRLRIMKGSEATGLAPRAMEKCKNRS